MKHFRVLSILIGICIGICEWGGSISYAQIQKPVRQSQVPGVFNGNLRTNPKPTPGNHPPGGGPIGGVIVPGPGNHPPSGTGTAFPGGDLRMDNVAPTPGPGNPVPPKPAVGPGNHPSGPPSDTVPHVGGPHNHGTQQGGEEGSSSIAGVSGGDGTLEGKQIFADSQERAIDRPSTPDAEVRNLQDLSKIIFQEDSMTPLPDF